MKSRAHMLLEKEYARLQKEPHWGVVSKPLNDEDIFVWEATIKGLKDTMWEGGIFKLYLKFNELYNCAPPQLMFTTIPFHPNVDITNGKPCIDFLDNAEDWKQSYNVGYILLSLQTLLANPVLENAVNSEAASMYIDNPDIYRQMVLNCVLASKRIDAGLSPYLNNEDGALRSAQYNEEGEQNSCKSKHHTSHVSFEDYLLLWKGIATSNPSEIAHNPLNEYLKTDNKLQNAHFQLSQKELEQEIRMQLAEHNRLMYGTFNREEDCSLYSMGDHRNNRINLLGQICLSKPSTEPTSGVQSAALDKDCEELDREVDDLVNWTRSLSPEQINF